MTLPSLPLINDCLFIDNSAIELFQSCPRMFQHNRLDKRIPTEQKPSLNFGGAIHKALEWRYRNCKSNCPTMIDEEEQVKVLQEFFVENPVPDDEEWRNINTAVELMRRYNIRHNTEPFNILLDKDSQPLVELSFAAPLFDFYPEKGIGDPSVSKIPVFYCGRIDLPVSWDNQLIIIDHKTDSMFYGAQRFLEEQKCSNQYRGYCWAFEQTTGKPVDGYCVNGIPTKKPPMKPRQGTLDDWYAEHFVRDVTYLALYPNWREEWKSETISIIENMLWCYQRGDFPMWGKFTRQCSRYGGCMYKDICLVPPNQRETNLNSPFFTENKWTPLQQTNIKTQNENQ